MPIMNGFKSAEAIYKYFDENQARADQNQIKRPMIFAMTVFKEIKKYNWIPKKCKEAGMKGVLYKPVAKQGLVN